MKKFLVIIVAVFMIPICSVIGKSIYDAVTENYTFANTSFAGNLSVVPWLVPYARSMWWVIPIAAVVIIILYVMKRQEPQPPQMPTFKVPRQSKQKNLPPPPMFIKK